MSYINERMSYGNRTAIDPQPFYRILHAALSQKTCLEEHARTSMAMNWVELNRATLERVLDRTEMRVLEILMKHFEIFWETPTRESCNVIVASEPHPDLFKELLANYAKHRPWPKDITSRDMDIYLQRRGLPAGPHDHTAPECH